MQDSIYKKYPIVNKIKKEFESLSEIVEVDFDKFLYTIDILPNNKKNCPIKFTIVKEVDEILIFLKGVSGAIFELDIYDEKYFLHILDSILISEIQINSYYKKNNVIANKVFFNINNLKAYSFVYINKIFWKFLYDNKKIKKYLPYKSEILHKTTKSKYFNFGNGTN